MIGWSGSWRDVDANADDVDDAADVDDARIASPVALLGEDTPRRADRPLHSDRGSDPEGVEVSVIDRARARLSVAARRIGRPVIERARPVLLADQGRGLAAAQANVAALEAAVEDLTRQVRELEARLAVLESDHTD